MNRFGSLSRIVLTSLCVGLIVPAVACSSDDSSNGNNNNNSTGDGDGNGNGDGNGDGTSGGKCQLAPGEYTVTTTKDPSSDEICPEGQTSSVTIKDEEGDGGTEPTETEGCTTETNEATCSSKVTCHIEQSGTVSDSVSESTLGSDGQSYSGSYSTKTVAGDMTINCKYSVEAKKK